MLAAIRGWAERYTREGKYSPVGVWFHWIMAALALYQLISGWQMSRLPVGGEKLGAYAQHSQIGLLLLFVAILRGLWRLLVSDPINDSHSPPWQRTAAEWTQLSFYGLFALLPLSGWCMWSAIQPVEPLSLAGIIPLPAMPFYDLSPAWQREVLDAARRLHVAGVIGLALLIPLHVGAALHHHFWTSDDVVRGILPEIPDYEMPAREPAPPAPRSLPQ